LKEEQKSATLCVLTHGLGPTRHRPRGLLQPHVNSSPGSSRATAVVGEERGELGIAPWGESSMLLRLTREGEERRSGVWGKKGERWAAIYGGEAPEHGGHVSPLQQFVEHVASATVAILSGHFWRLLLGFGHGSL
jgi:hypothetical protein